MKKDPKYCILYIFTTVTMVLYGTVNVLVALCLKETVDAAIAQDMQLFGRALLYTLLVALVDFGFGNLSQYALQSYCKSKIIQAKTNRYMQLLHGQTDGEEALDIASFSTDVDLLYEKNYVNRGMLIYYFTQLILSVVSIVVLSWKVSLVVLVTVFLPMLVPALLSKKLQRATQEYTDGMKEYLDFVQDSLQGVHEIRTYHAFDFFSELHKGKNMTAERKRQKNMMMSYLNNITSSFVGTLSFVAMIAACGYLTVRGEIGMGTLIAVIQLLNTVVGPIGLISEVFGGFSATKQLVQKYEAYPAEKTDDGVQHTIARIETKGLGYSYDGNSTVLQDVNVKFERGKCYALKGESGAGKSTLAKLLAGILPGYSGDIILIDESGAALDFSDYAYHIQYVAQEPYLFKLSPEDNVYLGCEKDGQQLQQQTQALGIGELFEKPDTMLENRDRISGGQKQRLVIARALNHMPEVLILDEPTANLDAATSKRVMEHILAARCGILIVITHSEDKEFLSSFDEVITL